MKVKLFSFLFLLILCLSISSYAQEFNVYKEVGDNNGLRKMRVIVDKINFSVSEERHFDVDLTAEVTIVIEVRNIDWYNVNSSVNLNNYQNRLVLNGVELVETPEVIISGGGVSGGEREMTFSNLILNLGKIDLKNPPETYFFDVSIRAESSRQDNFNFSIPLKVDVASIFSSSVSVGNTEVFKFDSIEKLVNKESRVGFNSFKMLSNDPNNKYKLEAAIVFGSNDPMRNAKVYLGLNGASFKELNEDYQEIWQGGAGNHIYSLDLRVIPGFETEPGTYTPQISYRLVSVD